MKLAYDPVSDVLRIEFNKADVDRHVLDAPGVVLGYNKTGGLVNCTISEASRHVDNLRHMDMAVDGKNIRGIRLF